MWSNQLKLALRNVVKHRLFSAINIVGLAIGIASFLLIFLFVQDELSYDKHMPNADRVFRISGSYNQGGEELTTTASTPYQLAPVLKENFQQIESITRLYGQSRPIRVGDQFFMEDDIYYADETFFEVFRHRFVFGQATTALEAPNSVVITETISQRYFGGKDPVGEVIDFNGFKATVTGMIEDPAETSHFHPAFIISGSTIEASLPNWMLTNWGGTSHWTYCLVKPNADPVFLAEAFSDLINGSHAEEAYPHHYFLQPLGDIHLYSNINGELEPNSDILYVYIFSIVGLIILTIASINYINLSVAGATYRIKEVGMRRTMGASRKEMILQFQAESIVLALVAGIIGIMLVEIFAPTFNALTDRALTAQIYADLTYASLILGLSTLIGLIAGTFPALFLLKFDAVTALKGNPDNHRSKLFSSRNVLVVFQFSISIVLLTGTFIVFEQLKYMRQKDLGINTEHVIEIPLQTSQIADQLDTFKQRLASNKSIMNVSGANNSVTRRVGGWRGYKLPDQKEWVNIPTIIVDIDFVKTLEADMAQGRDFSKAMPSDFDQAYIINESAQKFLGLEEPIGQPITGAIFTGEKWGRKNARIIGVVKDFNFASLHTEIQPLAFSLKTPDTFGLSTMILRVEGQNIGATLTYVEGVWKELAPERPFVYNFMDENIERHYTAENKFLNLFTIFSTLAIIIGCMGLFGLSVYTIQRKIKEIGIRKVLGASVSGLVQLISWEFIKLVLVANLIAWPASYYFMNLWLENYAYRIEVNFIPFIGAACMAILIAFLTISFQTFKTALSNPVKALKDE